MPPCNPRYFYWTSIINSVSFSTLIVSYIANPLETHSDDKVQLKETAEPVVGIPSGRHIGKEAGTRRLIGSLATICSPKYTPPSASPP